MPTSIKGTARLATTVSRPPTAVNLAGSTNNAISKRKVKGSNQAISVGALTATDPNANATHTFSVTLQTNDASPAVAVNYFGVNNSNALIANSTIVPDIYYVKIKATNGSGLYAEQIFTITVLSPFEIKVANNTNDVTVVLQKSVNASTDYILGQISSNLTGTVTYTLAELE